MPTVHEKMEFPLGERFKASLTDPFDFYEDTYEASPVFPVRLDGHENPVFVVTSYDLVKYVFDTATLFSSEFHHVLHPAKDHYVESEEVLAGGYTLPPLLLNIDAPDHKRYRNLLGPIFNAKNVTPLKDELGAIMDDLIDQVIEQGECDFIRDIAVPFPTVMIARIMGYEPEIVSQLAVWSDAMIMRISQSQSAQQDFRYATLIRDFQNYIRAIAAARRAEPRDDLTSQIVHVEQDGFRLTEDEACTLIHELTVSGHETARNSTIGGLGLLLRDPEMLARLKASPNLIPRAVEEILRLFTPVAGMWRIATQDTELGGVAITAGSTILVRMDAANRDPRAFPNPNRIDLERRNLNAHLSFGWGPHYCIGNLLARTEVVIALTKVIERFENIRLIEEKSDLGRPRHIILRSTNALHIAYDKGEKVERVVNS
jgi:cytochrome P450